MNARCALLPAVTPDAPSLPPPETATSGRPAQARWWRFVRAHRIAVHGLALLLCTLLGVWAWWPLRHQLGMPAARVVASTSDEGSLVDSGEPFPADGDDAHDQALATMAGPGRLTVAGKILDGNGEAVASVQVFAELEPPQPLPGSAATGAHSAGPAQTFTSWRAIAAPSDRHGAFALTGLVPGSYRIVVRSPTVSTAMLRNVAVPTSQDLQIVVARRVALAGIVMDGRQPVRGVAVAIRGEALGGMLQLRTDADGRFTFRDLPEGGYQIWAWTTNRVAPPQRVLRRAQLPAGEVQLQLQPATTVVGRVIDQEDGTGVVAAVELTPADEREIPRYAVSGADGTFRIEGVPLGRWVADAYAPGYLTIQTSELQAGQGVPEILVSTGALLTGKVVTSDGRAVAGADVRALVAGGRELSAAAEVDTLRRFDGAVTTAHRKVARAAGSGGLSVSGGANPSSGNWFEPIGELGVLHGRLPAIPVIPPTAGDGPSTGPSSTQAAAPPSTPGADLAAAHAAIPQGALRAVPLVNSPVRPAVVAADPSKTSHFTTDQDGMFLIRAVPPGPVALLARAPGYAQSKMVLPDAVAGEVQANLTIVLGAGTYLTGEVRSSQGGALAGAQVTALAAPPQENTLHVEALAANGSAGVLATAVADVTGRYRIGPVTGQIVLHARARDHLPLVAALHLPSAAPGEAVHARAPEIKHNLELIFANASVNGIVADARGVALAGALVTLADGPPRQAVVAADGTFTLRGLAPGAVRLRITHRDYPTFFVDASTTTPVRAAVPLGGGIAGVVLAKQSGEPLTNASIAGQGPEGANTRAGVDARGQFVLRGLALGHWRLVASAPGYGQATRLVEITTAADPGGASVRDVRLELDQPTQLSGVVRDNRGARVAGASVVAQNASGKCSTLTSAEGEFVLRNCPSGDLTVSAEKADRTGALERAVRPGDTARNLTIALP